MGGKTMDDLTRERDDRADLIAEELRQWNNPADIDKLLAAAKKWPVGARVKIPGRPNCRGYVTAAVTEGLQVGVSHLPGRYGASFFASGSQLAKEQDNG